MFLSKIGKYIAYGRVVAQVLDKKGLTYHGLSASQIEGAIEKALTSADGIADTVRQAGREVKDSLKK